MGSEEGAVSTVKQAMDQGSKVADKASQTVKEGYKAAQQFAEARSRPGQVRSQRTLVSPGNSVCDWLRRDSTHPACFLMESMENVWETRTAAASQRR